VEDFVKIVGLSLGGGGADSLEELLEDSVEAADFVPCGAEVVAEGLLVAFFQVADFSLEELEVEGEGVEGVSDLVGDSGSEEGEGVELFGFYFFCGFSADVGDITDKHDVAVVCFVFFLGDGGEVEVEVAIFGVEDFEVAADGASGGSL
jgi:hypothetical protein